MAGYSGKPLFDKLNLKPHYRVGVSEPLAGLAGELESLETAPIDLEDSIDASLDASLLFSLDTAGLESALARTIPRMADPGLIWLAWPKRSSGLVTSLTEADVRRIGLATGWVDVKVCAIDDAWSGLKFLRRRK